MLLTTVNEIRACLPTSTVEDPTALLTVIEDAEQNYLEPVLGSPLYDFLQDEYERELRERGSIVEGTIPREELKPVIELIRLCQKSAIYFALANNVGLMAVSVNEGGGMNVMEADGFAAADEKRLERFSRDAYLNAYRGVDRILSFLERDAKKKDSVFADKWKKSEYYYLHGDLLFSTAIQMKQYVSDCQCRQDYIKMLPVIRFCQSAYIVPELGDELLALLIKSTVDDSVIPLEPAGSKDVWHHAIDKIRMALGAFVTWKISKDKTREEGATSLILNQALSYIRNHADSFGKAYRESPMYDASADRADDAQQSEMARKIFDPDDNGNMISTIFGFGVNRH